MQKKIFSMILLTVLLLNSMPPAKAEIDKRYYRGAAVDGKNADRVHLRADPSQSSESLGLYFTGTYILSDSDFSKEWSHVFIGAESGYMKTRYLSCEGNWPASKQPEGYIKQGGAVNIYAELFADAQISSAAKAGDMVIIQGETKTHWYYVLRNGISGYIKSSDISTQKNNGYTPKAFSKPSSSAPEDFKKVYGAYTKEMIFTDFPSKGRAFYSLAVVRVPNALGAYMHENGGDVFLYNGSIVKCIYPPENGFILAEASWSAAGDIDEKALSFDLSDTALNFTVGRFVAETELYGEPIMDYASSQIVHALEPCHVFHIKKGYNSQRMFYFVETQSDCGYVPAEFVELCDKQ